MVKLKSALRDENGKRVTKKKWLARKQNGGMIKVAACDGFRKLTKSQRKAIGVRNLVKVEDDATGKDKWVEQPQKKQKYDGANLDLAINNGFMLITQLINRAVHINKR